VGKPEGKRLPGDQVAGWMDNIEMDLGDIRFWVY
jgi:hypothetical protein